VCTVAAALIAVFLLWRFQAPRRVGLLVLVTCWYTWLTSFSVVALVPLDVWMALSANKAPSMDHAISVLWKISYWSTQALTWAVIPIQQGYVLSGAFTIMGRINSAFRRLWIFWLIVGSLAIIAIILATALGKLTLATLPTVIVALSNTYGLIAIVVLLGYGLVEVPRVLWRSSFPESRVLWRFHRVGKSAQRLENATNELEKCLAVVLLTSQQIPRSQEALRKRIDALVAYADSYSPIPLSTVTGTKLDIESMEERDLDYAGDIKGIAQLRARLKLAIADFVGYKGEYISDVKSGIELQNVCEARHTGVYIPPTSCSLLSRIVWRYKCIVRPYVVRFFSLLAFAASLIVLWCEATIGSGRQPDLSPFSLAVHDNTVIASPWLEQFIVAAPLAYVASATYYSLFQLGSLGPYHLVPKATWSWSLLLNASLLARFAAPLAFNYLHVIRMVGSPMVFISIMGLEEVPLLGTGFNTWFPLVMVVYVIVLATNICETCANKLLLPLRIQFTGEHAEEEYIARGRELVRQESEAIKSGRPLGDATQLHALSLQSTSQRSEVQLPGQPPLPPPPPSQSPLTTSHSKSEREHTTERYPLFASQNRSDSVLYAPVDEQAPDAADRLFAGVGESRRGRGRRHRD
jgi:hypothetical protein